MPRLSVVAPLALICALIPAPEVAACGGFFCDGTGVDQAGEDILFAIGDGTVDVTIRIDYSGPAEEFAWVLPVPAEPEEIGTSASLVFDRLREATDPVWQYTLDENSRATRVPPAPGVPCES